MNTEEEVNRADSEEGITIGLIDAIIAICEVLSARDMFDEKDLIQEALKDLRSNDTMKMLMDIGELQDAKDYIQEQKKIINLLCSSSELLKRIGSTDRQQSQSADVAEKKGELLKCDECGNEFELLETSMGYSGEVDICEPCQLKANFSKFAIESIAENERIHQQIENIEVGDKDEEIKRLREALEQLGKAVTEYMPKVDTQNEKQMKLYTVYHTTKQALNPNG